MEIHRRSLVRGGLGAGLVLPHASRAVDTALATTANGQVQGLRDPTRSVTFWTARN